MGNADFDTMSQTNVTSQSGHRSMGEVDRDAGQPQGLEGGCSQGAALSSLGA